jgi:hypothetical protein
LLFLAHHAKEPWETLVPDAAPSGFARRVLLRAGLAAAGVALAARTRAAMPSDPFPGGATLLVAGPEGGATDHWADWLTPLLDTSLSGASHLRVETVGGIDGVTGANKFDARVAPDGNTALLVPGLAALAWLVGDTRVQFDVAHWEPAFAAVGSAVVVGRVSPERFAPGERWRVGAAGPTGPDMAALLALDQLGVTIVPVFGLQSEAAARDAFAQDAIDLAFLHGRNVPQQVSDLKAIGAAPLFSLGATSDTGQITRDPQFPNIPAMPELFARFHGNAPSGALYSAWRAAAAAAQLEVTLLLPQLTPAAMVALWRHACNQAAGSPILAQTLSPLGLRAVGSPSAMACTSAIAVNASSLLELRRWLANRFNWHPS